MAAIVLAPALLIPFAEAIGIVTAGLSLAALSDLVSDYMEDNPEKSEMILGMLNPAEGILSGGFNALFNKKSKGGEEEISLEEIETKPKRKRSKKEVVLEALRKKKGNYASPDAEGNYADPRGRVIRGLADEGKITDKPDPNYDPSKKYQGYKKFFNKAEGGMAGTKTYHQYHYQYVPMDEESMMYANGGGVGSMMVPTKNFVMQGDKKPARNYLGNQQTVNKIPVKWQSGPNTPPTELAYITNAEKDLILKQDLHGSLKNGPNTGPDGIMSLDSQGDYSPDRSPSGRGGRSRQGQAQHNAHMKSILTGQRNIGQTSKVSDRTRRGAVPEYVNTPGGMKYVGSAYKSYGQPGFFGNLFGGANPGYRATYGTGSGLLDKFFGSRIKTRGTPGQPGFEYFSEDEQVGDVKPGLGGRLTGGILGALTGLPFGVGSTIGSTIDRFKPKNMYDDMSKFNRLGLGGVDPAALDFDPDAKIQNTSFIQNTDLNTPKKSYIDLDKSISSELDYNIPITDRWSEQTGENLTEAGNYSQNAVAGQLFGTALFDNLTPLQQGQVNDAINTYGTTSQGFLSNK